MEMFETPIIVDVTILSSEHHPDHHHLHHGQGDLTSPIEDSRWPSGFHCGHHDDVSSGKEHKHLHWLVSTINGR